ncbi:MAG: hypothetical protein H6586_06605 [Flavobacteriales bacterium]|nr:hypothetical protein [Flavobacteriales bacterium]
MNTIKSISYLILIISIALFSCTKEGKQGETGPAGVNGNANVKSETFTIFPSNWQTSGNTIYVNRTTSLITTNIANSGAVLLYIQSTNSTAWQALPYTFPGTNQIYRYWHSDGELQIQVYDSQSTPYITSNRNFKLVTISSTAKVANPNIDYNNYYEVKGAFNLKRLNYSYDN